MRKSIVVNNETLRGMKLASDGTVSSIKKRVKDHNMITDMLRVGSKYKLGLKQYKFLMIRQARETIQPYQRDMITNMYNDYKLINK